MNSSVIIYAYYMSESNDFNLSYFVKKELTYKDNIFYIIVINGYNHNENIIFPNLENLVVIKRENIGFDFGAYNAGLKYIEDNNKQFDYYFFLNAGVIGPIIPHYYRENHWTTIFHKKINKNVKLVGTSIVCLSSYDSGGFGPKVEGFFFVVDKIGLQLLKNQQNIFCDHQNKHDAVVNGEYGLSNCIFKSGYTIDCMLPRYQNIDWTDKNNYFLNYNMHPSRENSFYGYSINPYDVIFHKWYWSNTPNNKVNYNIVKQFIDENN